MVGAAFALQAVLAFLVLKTPWGRATIQAMSDGVAELLGYATKGTEFLFGPTASNPLANTFAIAALPVIIFFAAWSRSSTTSASCSGSCAGSAARSAG